jgi:flagellar assembly factor FliW
VNVMTLRFGDIEIDEKRVIEMPDGMLGFTDRRFIIISPDKYGQFFWLQSLDNPELAFVVTDPALFVQGYEVNLTPDEFERIKLSPDSEAIILAVVTMAPDVFDITLNLQGPIVVNRENMLAKQIVLEEGKYATKHPLFARDLSFSPLPCDDEVTPAQLPSLEKITTICCNL